jgi:hypothetical protein
MYPLSPSFDFKNVTTDTTIVSKVKVPLPIFPIKMISADSVDRFLVKVETDVERILGSYGPKERDACMTVKLSNGGCLN